MKMTTDIEPTANNIRAAVKQAVARARGIQPDQVTDEMTILDVAQFGDEMGMACVQMGLRLCITRNSMKVGDVISQLRFLVQRRLYFLTAQKAVAFMGGFHFLDIKPNNQT